MSHTITSHDTMPHDAGIGTHGRSLEEAQRRALLHAMGVDVYVLRGAGPRGASAAADPIVAAESAPAAPPSGDEVDLVVAVSLDAARAVAASRLRNLLPLALGVPAARIRWISADARGALPEPPPARAYLALGADMPRALGANLSTMQQMSATIAAADEPSASLRDGLAKRALWQAFKPLARQLRS